MGGSKALKSAFPLESRGQGLERRGGAGLDGECRSPPARLRDRLALSWPGTSFHAKPVRGTDFHPASSRDLGPAQGSYYIQFRYVSIAIRPGPAEAQTRLSSHFPAQCLSTRLSSHLRVWALGAARRVAAVTPNVGFRGCHGPTRYVSIMVCLRFRGAARQVPDAALRRKSPARFGVACVGQCLIEPLTVTSKY